MDENIDAEETGETPFCNSTHTSDFLDEECILRINNNLQDNACLNNEECHQRLHKECVTPLKSSSAFPEKDSPITPTANLKVLLHAISPEIRNNEKRKQLLTNHDRSSPEYYFDNANRHYDTFKKENVEDIAQQPTATNSLTTPNLKDKVSICIM